MNISINVPVEKLLPHCVHVKLSSYVYTKISVAAVFIVSVMLATYCIFRQILLIGMIPDISISSLFIFMTTKYMF
jgi:hypothetical protein